MYVFTKCISPYPHSFALDYARTEEEREKFLNEYDGWNYSLNIGMKKGFNFDEAKIGKYRLRSIIHAARLEKDKENRRIFPPMTPRQRRQSSRIPCPF